MPSPVKPLAIGAKVLWFQTGTDSDEALRAVADGGITVITRRCMGHAWDARPWAGTALAQVTATAGA